MPLPKSILCTACKRTYPEGWKRCPYCSFDPLQARRDADASRILQRQLQQRGRAFPGREQPQKSRAQRGSRPGRGDEKRPVTGVEQTRRGAPPRPDERAAQPQQHEQRRGERRRGRDRRRRGARAGQPTQEQQQIRGPRPEGNSESTTPRAAAAAQPQPRPPRPARERRPQSSREEARPAVSEAVAGPDSGDVKKRRKRFRRRRRGRGGAQGAPPETPTQP